MSVSEWRETKLDEVLNFYNGKKRPTESGNIPVYGGNGILITAVAIILKAKAS